MSRKPKSSAVPKIVSAAAPVPDVPKDVQPTPDAAQTDVAMAGADAFHAEPAGQTDAQPAPEQPAPPTEPVRSEPVAAAPPPLPEVKAEVTAMISVVCHSEKGRRRVGRRWAAGETLIPVAALSDYELAQMRGDPLFTVVLPPALGA